MDSYLIRDVVRCKDYLKTLTTQIDTRDRVVTWFQELCDNLTQMLLGIKNHIKDVQPLENQGKDTMLLYLLQLNTGLSVLINNFTLEHKMCVTITEARYCITKQISLCLTGLEEVLTKSISPDCPTINGFVKYMDLALDKITEVDVEKGSQLALNVCGEVRTVIEEVLCHGMSIAQVALKEDCDSIKGGSKEVLNSLESICDQISKPEPNIAMCNLFVDACCDKLCALERKVNTAVLKLSLKVFSECTKPLDDLHAFCSSRGNGGSDEDLDELIADFDLHVDRMIQIGLFAVACSTDANCTLKMRDCLASLEALEGELVPALTTLRKERNLHNVCFAAVLKFYWTMQAKALKKYIYLIIDPFAFCQVTHEVIRDINLDLEERFKNAATVDKEFIKPITLQSIILHEMLEVSLKDCPPENREIIKKYLNDVINVTIEIDAAADKLLTEEVICKENVFRVFKRCKIQENILKKLLVSLREDYKEKEVSTVESTKDEKESSKENRIMDEIVNRGKQILKDRSVLYKTPTINCSANKGNKPLPLSRLVHLRNMQFSRISNESSSTSLQITDILVDLSTISGSFAHHY